MKAHINKIRILAATLLVFIALGASSQELLKKAQELKANYDYSQAVDLYQKHFQNTPPGIQDAREVAECYAQMSDARSAEEWYARVAAFEERTPMDIYNFANSLKTNGRYEEAMLQYNQFGLLSPFFAELARQETQECVCAMEWMANPTFYEVANLEQFNSENSDFGMMPFGDGYMLASDRRLSGVTYLKGDVYGWTGDPYLKLFTTASQAAALNEALGINNEYHNGPAVYDKKDQVLYFTRTKMVKVKKEPVNSDPTSWYNRYNQVEYVNRLELYSSTYENGQWSGVVPFVYNNAENYSVGHAALSPDGQTLYFVSDKPGGYGDADLYYCVRQEDKSWGSPVNAGYLINTPGKEVFPYVSPEGILYFSSDGHPGMGGLDLFRSFGSRNAWSDPENLKYPINSPRDDFSINLPSDTTSGTFSSNRNGGRGSDDIYTFNFVPPTEMIIVVTTLERMEDGSIDPLDRVLVTAKKGDEEATYFEALTNETGGYSRVIDCESRYALKGTKPGYFTGTAYVETSKCKTRSDTVFAEMVLDKIVIAKPIVLENIYYDFDKWNIRPDAAIELNKLVTILVNNPGISIELGSHTDCRGTTPYNATLSQKRAESAVAYIISRGIDAKRITAKGYGESVPVNGCVDDAECTEEQHQMNRRTEFKVTKSD